LLISTLGRPSCRGLRGTLAEDLDKQEFYIMQSKKSKSASGVNRREMFLAGATAGVASLFSPQGAGAAAGLPVRANGPDVYALFGVKPFINCTSTYTINGGSAMLPEVIEAMNNASFYPVNFDELMEGAGKRISELLQVESAMVSSGTAGSMTCATLACVAGGDPEKMQQLPDTTGIKGEAIVPRWSRSVYDHAVRSTGVKMIEVDTLEDLEKAMQPIMGQRVAELWKRRRELSGKIMTESKHLAHRWAVALIARSSEIC
jgi:hypothetical protein